MIIKRLISAFLVSTIMLLNGFTSIYASELSDQRLNNSIYSPDNQLSNDSTDSDIDQAENEPIDAQSNDLSKEGTAESEVSTSDNANGYMKEVSKDSGLTSEDNGENQIINGPIFHCNYQSIADGDFMKKDGSPLDRILDETVYQSKLEEDKTLGDVIDKINKDLAPHAFSVVGFSTSPDGELAYFAPKDRDVKISDIKSDLYVIWTKAKKYNISLSIKDNDERVDLPLTVNTGTWIGETMEEIADNFKITLANGASKSFILPGDTEILRDEDTFENGWNITIDDSSYKITSITDEKTTNKTYDEFNINILVEKIKKPMKASAKDVPNTGIFDDIKPFILALGLSIIGICLIAYQKLAISRRTYEWFIRNRRVFSKSKI